MWRRGRLRDVKPARQQHPVPPREGTLEEELHGRDSGRRLAGEGDERPAIRRKVSRNWVQVQQGPPSGCGEAP
ncbi:hypothetical protein E2C01_057502 [Portunus trituberculatus]|uniref:Uncharacterized protein n=1 Tax=Portunus trituberculatus TaxID=210409 RepID=A0A5B7H188_PORTR|nr:hypothetical protein [Portunus trituberculatus]